MIQYLPFEKPIEALDKHVAELGAHPDGAEEAAMLADRAGRLLADTYARLTPWQRTLVARHPQRPRFEKLVGGLFTDFLPLAGDRVFGEDTAIIGGFARFETRRVMVIGHVKGEDTTARIAHNFGMARPEGYRKAIRMMELADRFGLPVVTLVDTPGAFPGVDAEARGQAEAIARSTEACLGLGVPLIAVIIGEGGSGGAVALAAANRVLMCEHAVYSVISPEGCASILWRTSEKAADAAQAMKVTAQHLKRDNVIDRIVKEPVGGAHRDPQAAARMLGAALAEELDQLAGESSADLLAGREQRFLAIGG